MSYFIEPFISQIPVYMNQVHPHFSVPSTDGIWIAFELIGKGSSSSVYKGFGINEPKIVAIKRFDEPIASIREALMPEVKVSNFHLRNILNRSKILARCSSKEVIQLIEIIKHERTLYLIMEFEEGNLLDRIEKCRLENNLLSEEQINQIAYWKS